MLEKEFQWFKDHQDELVEKYQGKYLIIVDQEVKAVFDTDPEAYGYAVDHFEYGSFLIQHCISGEQAYTQTFHSGIKF